MAKKKKRSAGKKGKRGMHMMPGGRMMSGVKMKRMTGKRKK